MPTGCPMHTFGGKLSMVEGMTTTISDTRLTGERAAFGAKDATIVNVIFAEGESPLKHGQNLDIRHTVFEWKYPLWYAKHVTVVDSSLLETARSGLWYMDDVTLRRVLVAAPKTLRRSRHIVLENVCMADAAETMWSCDDISMKDVSVHGDYFGMNCSNVVADGLNVSGNYAFDGGHDIEIANSTLLSKDAFWNCENVVVRDSTIIGEYLGWNSRNVTLINCTIESLQGLCQIDGLVMRGCKLINTTLAFEYSTVDVEVESTIDSVINPSGGVIKSRGIGELTIDADLVDATATKIITES